MTVDEPGYEKALDAHNRDQEEDLLQVGSEESGQGP